MDAVGGKREFNALIYRLVNEKQPQFFIQLTAQAWRQILELGQLNGWIPYGTRAAAWWLGHRRNYSDLEESYSNDGYLSNSPRLVVIEDALNLSEALDRAFFAFEPIFVRQEIGWAGFADTEPRAQRPPGIAVIRQVQEVSSRGAFQILPYERSLTALNLSVE